MGLMGEMGVKFFEPPSSSFQGGRHISHQTSLLPVEKECNRPWCSERLPGIKALDMIVRAWTAWGSKLCISRFMNIYNLSIMYTFLENMFKVLKMAANNEQ